jgi:hypothetical protein
MASIKTRQQLPDVAKPTADLIEKLGFSWELDFEYPTPDPAKRVQIREEKHYIPREMVMRIAAAMARGDKLPPVVVTKDGYLIDGNTRTEAARHNKYPSVQALVVTEAYEGCTEKVARRLQLLGAAFNVRNGKGIDREETRKAIEKIGEDPTYDGTRIAALIGVTDATVKSILAEVKARKRAESVGVHLNGSVAATPLRILGQASEKLNDEPFRAVASLAADTGMSPGDLREIIRQMREEKSDEGALRVIDEHRRARREQIAEYRASGKSKPPPAAKLRQRLGFILDFEANPRELTELNPDVVIKHQEAIRRSIAVLQAVLAAHDTLPEAG